MKAILKIIEKNEVKREYGFTGTEAIIEHPDHGRLYIADGFGGIDTLAGGNVRYQHGILIKLKKGDTLNSLKNSQWNDHTTLFDAVCHGYDENRKVLEWDGFAIEKLAESLSLDA